MSVKNKNPLTIILIGPSGSGKGTQARLLIDRLDFEYIEMGKILREEAKKDTKLGKFIYQTIMVEGRLLPDEIANELLEEKINLLSKNKKLIIDGYPRTVDQVKDLDNILRDLQRNNIIAINVDVPEQVSLARLTSRLVCNKCKNNFKENGLKKGHKCPNCNGRLIKRADDTPQKIKERLRWAKEEVEPVVEEYRSRGLLADIDGNQALEIVYDNILENIKEHV